MKKFIPFMFMALAMIYNDAARAYTSPVGEDPKNGSYNTEYKYVVKSAIAGESGAIVVGDVLTYASAYDGYTVTKTGGSATYNGQRAIACVAVEAIATGDTNYHRCAVRGFIDTLKYDASVGAISRFQNLCVNQQAAVEPCTIASITTGGGIGLQGTATANHGRIIPLEAKASGTGTSLKAIINIP